MTKAPNGFSLLETLIVLTILAIIATFSFPSFKPNHHLLDSYLISAIQFAEQEARAKHIATAICPSSTQLTCNGNWEDGLIIFSDQYADGLIHEQQQILTVMPSQSSQGQLHWRSFPHYRHYLRFQPIGINTSDNGTFWFCPKGKAMPTWAVILNQTGKYRIMYPNKEGVIKDSQNEKLTCITNNARLPQSR